MAARLRSASTNQILRLTLKASLVAFILYWVRLGGIGAGPLLLFLFLALYFYFRPPIGAGRFFPSFLVLISLPLAVPRVPGILELFVIAGWGALYFSVIGIKNFLLIRRRETYRLTHFILISALAVLFFAHFGFGAQIVMFITLLFLFREFYVTALSLPPRDAALVAAVEAFLLVEIAWIISFLSLSFLASAALLVLTAFASHDSARHYFERTLSENLLLRNTGVFVALTALIFLFLA